MINLDKNLLDVAKNLEDQFLKAWAQADGKSNIFIKADYQKFDGITNLVTVALHLLRDSSVIDIGCNSGIHSIVSSLVAKNVTGYDVEELFINRARSAAVALKNAYNSQGELNFELDDFTRGLKGKQFNAVIAARILYHVGDEKIEILKSYCTENVEKIIIQCRPCRDKIYSSGQVARTTLYGGLYKVRDCIQFIEDCGFTEYSVWGLEELWKDGENFPVIYASKSKISKILSK